jgi:GAF domain-containing protein
MRRPSRAGPERSKSRRGKTKTQKHLGGLKTTRLRNSSAADHKTQSDVAQLARERDEALEREKATAEVLRVISSSPGELQPVFDAMLTNAIRICDAEFGNLLLFDGKGFRAAAYHNAPEAYAEMYRKGPMDPGPQSALGRIISTKKVVLIADITAERGGVERDPSRVAAVELLKARTLLAVPMLREDELVGAIVIYRQEVRPFTDKQIELVQNFAAQAVIAIENTRLLNELRQRTNDLTEALEQQTATSEVLQVISSSAGELDPVFQTMLANAVRICSAKFGIMYEFADGTFRALSSLGAPPAQNQQPHVVSEHPHNPLTRLAENKTVVHVPDLSVDQAYIERNPRIVALVESGGARNLLLVPMLKDGKLLGAIAIYRQEARPFTDKQIDLVTNFAAQAVIAIENTRLLNELRQRTDDLSEALEQQTATSEVLGVISSSPGELEPVFQTMLTNAVRICEAKFGTLYLREADGFRAVALHDAPAAYVEARATIVHPPPDTSLGQAAMTKRAAQVADVKQTKGYQEGNPFTVSAVDAGGYRTVLSVPMLKEGELIGAVAIHRQEVRPFSDKQIELVQNFAAQAVIAIENTRLLNELRESLQQQTATAEVLKVISSSPGELGPVFETMLANAVQICGAKFGVMSLREGDAFRVSATHGAPPAFVEQRRREPLIRPTPGHNLERVMRTKEVAHIPDILADPESAPILAKFGGAKALVNVPLLKDGDLIGSIVIFRQEAGPFSGKQIELVKNFAAQAVIAIENTRLLNELRESLQQQTATSEVLQVISSSPGDLTPVFKSILANAKRIHLDCERHAATPEARRRSSGRHPVNGLLTIADLACGYFSVSRRPVRT